MEVSEVMAGLESVCLFKGSRSWWLYGGRRGIGSDAMAAIRTSDGG